MSAVITVCTALTSRGPCFQTRSPATPRGSWFTAITSAAVKISFASLLRLRKSAPMNRGDFSRDHRAKWLLCSFTVKPALPTCSQHQPDVSSFTCAKGGRRGGGGGGGGGGGFVAGPTLLAGGGGGGVVEDGSVQLSTLMP